MASEANPAFSRILRGVRNGQRFVVTSHGTPVARIVPANEPDEAWNVARAAFVARLRGQPIMHAGPWTRHEHYDDASGLPVTPPS